MRRRRLIARCTSILNKQNEADAEKLIRAIVPVLAKDDPSIQTGLSAFPPGISSDQKADYLADVAIVKDRLEISSAQRGQKEESFAAKHPWITGMVCSLVVGLILMFSFWNDAAKFAEDLWNSLWGRNEQQIEETAEPTPTELPDEDAAIFPEDTVDSPAPATLLPIPETENPSQEPVETIYNVLPGDQTISSSISNHKHISFSQSIKRRTRNTEPQLYSGPSKDYIHITGAHPSLVSKPVACAGEDHGWLLVRYKVGSLNRIGYIERIPGDEIADVKAVSYENWQVIVTEDCYVADGVENLIHVEEGDTLTCLGIIVEFDSSRQIISGETYIAFVEAGGEEGQARGVLKLSQIKDAE